MCCWRYLPCWLQVGFFGFFGFSYFTLLIYFNVMTLFIEGLASVVSSQSFFRPTPMRNILFSRQRMGFMSLAVELTISQCLGDMMSIFTRYELFYSFFLIFVFFLFLVLFFLLIFFFSRCVSKPSAPFPKKGWQS